MNKRELEAIYREDLSSFIQRSFREVFPGDTYVHNWHIDAIAWHLQQCYTGDIKRLIITIPPRHLKSLCASIAFPAWVMGKNPSRKIICASYAQELAREHSAFFRRLIESNFYQGLFRKTHFERLSENEVKTAKNGGRLATSVGGTLTGKGGNIIIIDDPIKPSDSLSGVGQANLREWYDGTLFSRLNNKKDDVIILIMQRLQMDDLVSYVMEKEKWIHLNIPAIAPADKDIQIGKESFHHWKAGTPIDPQRENLETLESIRNNIGSFNFNAQYLQNPVPITGNLIQWDWFKFYDSPPEREAFQYVVQSWDTASGVGENNDYSVCTTWGLLKEEIFLLDVFRRKLSYPNLKRAFENQFNTFLPDRVLVEYAGVGITLAQEYRRQFFNRILVEKPQDDKLTRMSTQTDKIYTGQVHLPRKAPWLDDFRREVLAFPGTRHDDQVDSMSQFLKWYKNKITLPKINRAILQSRKEVKRKDLVHREFNRDEEIGRREHRKSLEERILEGFDKNAPSLYISGF